MLVLLVLQVVKKNVILHLPMSKNIILLCYIVVVLSYYFGFVVLLKVPIL